MQLNCSPSCSLDLNVIVFLFFVFSFICAQVISMLCVLLQLSCFFSSLRSVPLGERLSLRRPLGVKSLAAGESGSLQPGHGGVPPPQAEWSIHHMAHRARQTSARPLLHRHVATHHRVSVLHVRYAKSGWVQMQSDTMWTLLSAHA